MVQLNSADTLSLMIESAFMTVGFFVSLAYIGYAKIGGQKNAERFVATQERLADHLDDARVLVSKLAAHASVKMDEQDMHASAVAVHSALGIAATNEAASSNALAVTVANAIDQVAATLPGPTKQS